MLTWLLNVPLLKIKNSGSRGWWCGAVFLPPTADRMNPLAWVPSCHTVCTAQGCLHDPSPQYHALSPMQHLSPSFAALKIWNYRFMGEFLKGPPRRKNSDTRNRKSQRSLELSGGDHYSQKPLHRGLIGSSLHPRPFARED